MEDKININDAFSAMAYIFNGGEFVYWLNEQEITLGAWKEYEEARDYFNKEIKQKFINKKNA